MSTVERQVREVRAAVTYFVTTANNPLSSTAMQRIVLSNLPHHITQRANNSQAVFFTPGHGFAVANDHVACLDFLPRRI